MIHSDALPSPPILLVPSSPQSPALPTHRSCLPYRALLTAGGGCKRDVKVCSHMPVSYPCCQGRQTGRFLRSSVRTERKKKQKAGGRGNVNKKEGSAPALCFSTIFTAEPYLRASPWTQSFSPPLPAPQGWWGAHFYLPSAVGCCPLALPPRPLCCSFNTAEMERINWLSHLCFGLPRGST